jgi:hypothetical protein
MKPKHVAKTVLLTIYEAETRSQNYVLLTIYEAETRTQN